MPEETLSPPQLIGDALIPYGYEVWKTGVYRRPTTLAPLLGDDGPSIDENVPDDRRGLLRRLSLRPIWISRVGTVRDVDQQSGALGDPLVELSYLTVHGQADSVWVDRASITDKKKLGELGAGWMPINSESAKGLLFYLERAEALNGSHTLAAVARRVGPYRVTDIDGSQPWGWVCGKKWIGPTAGVEADPRPGSTAFAVYNERGSWEEWKEKWRYLSSTSWVARFLIGASFASPLIRFLGEGGQGRSFILHQWGTSGGGKTALAVFAQSIWGNPTLEPLKTTFNRTEKSISGVFAYVTDLPVLYDEKQVSTVKSSQFIYDVCSGIPRGRAMKHGATRLDQPAWYVLARTTGEAPLVEEDDLGGQNNRTLQLHAVADNLTDPELSQLYGFSERTHGHAGPRYLARLATIVNDPAMLEKLRTMHKQIGAQLVARTRRSGNHITYAATIALGQILAEGWLLEVPMAVVWERALTDASKVLDENVPEQKIDFCEKALARMKDHRLSDGACYLDARNLNDEDLDRALANMKHLVGIRFHDAVVYVPSEINRILGRSGLSAQKVWRGFAERKWIRYDAEAASGRLTAKMSLGGSRIWVYSVASRVFNDGLELVQGGQAAAAGATVLAAAPAEMD